jgi:hypothetical protein
MVYENDRPKLRADVLQHWDDGAADGKVIQGGWDGCDESFNIQGEWVVVGCIFIPFMVLILKAESADQRQSGWWRGLIVCINI